MPATIGRAIDEGIGRRDDGRLVWWVSLLCGLGVTEICAALIRHRFSTYNFLAAAYRTTQVTVRQANLLGATLSKRTSAGEMVTIGTSDISQIGNVLDISARAAGAIVATLTVTAILLHASLPLGLVVVVGVPVLMAVVALLIRPLHQRQTAYRDQQGVLTARAGDIVAGLRILRGIGGEATVARRYHEHSQQLRGHGVRVARVASVLEAAQVLLPGMFILLVTWIGARFAAAGRITPGQLVAFYGYAAFLVAPLRTLTEAAHILTRGHVAAQRVVRMLALTPELVDPAVPASRPSIHGDLVDTESGVVVRPGRVTAIAAADPHDAVDIADRLGRYTEGTVTLSGVPLRDLTRATVREMIMVADNDARLFTGLLSLHILAALAGLGTPWLFGALVQSIKNGATVDGIDAIVVAIAGFVVGQSILTRFASFQSARLGEQVLAELREGFMHRVLDVPLSTVEQAGTGDLLTRTSRDVSRLSYSVRSAVPETLIAVITGALTIGAIVAVAPTLALPCLIGVPTLVVGTRWYLKRAPAAYLRQGASYAEITDGLAETVEGARTVEVLRIGAERRKRTDRDIAASFDAERFTLYLRTMWFPCTEAAYLLPVAATLLVGGFMAIRGQVTLGQVTAATLYVQQLNAPLDRLLSWLDELQASNASLRRLLGIAQLPIDRISTDTRPAGDLLTIADVRYAYYEGRDVLHGVTLAVTRGERIAIVSPSGAGKSTLGRLIAGIDGPRSGTVSVGGVPLVELPLDELRRQVALVTQEHHVFLGTLRDNVALARPDATDDEVRNALATVDALDWTLELPAGLDTEMGAGQHQLPPARAQQLALARLVLADPHTVVLDEAMSLIDLHAARHLESGRSAPSWRAER